MTDIELSGDSDVIKNYITGGIRGTAEVEPISDSMTISGNKLEGSYSGATTISFIRDGSAYPTIEAALDGVTEDVILYITSGEFGMFQTEDDFKFDHKVTIQSLNGADVTIRVVPSSGCGNTTNHTCLIDDETHNGINTDCPLNWNTPQRIQEPNAQYQIFNGFTDVAFSGIDFVFVPADFTLCINSDWKGTAYKESILNAEFQFKNTGDVSFTDCNFDRIIVSPFSSLGTTTIIGCTFSEVYDAYAIKDIHSMNAVIEDCEFTDCGGAIYFEGEVPKGEYTIRKNTFTNIDTEEWAEAGKAGTRGLIQFSASGDYSNALITVEGNESTGNTAVFRQLNQTVTSGILDTVSISADNDFGGEMFTSSSLVIDVNTIYLDTTINTSGNGTEGSPVKTLTEALSLVNAGGTIVVSGELSTISGINKPVTILGSGDEPVSVTGSLEIPNVNGTVRFVNLHFNGGNCIADYSNSNLSNLSMVFENCSFNNSHHTLYIQSTIHSLTLTDCIFTTGENVQIHSYLVWTYCVDEITVTGCMFNGNGNVRGAIHSGDGSESGTTVTIENTVFNGYERGLNLAFTNEDVSNEISITGCTFNDIADNPDDTAYDGTHTATVYIHSVQKPDTTSITYTNNKINGGSGHVFYSNNPVVSALDLVDESTFTGNTLDGETIDNLGSVCLDPWVVEVNGHGYRTLDEAIQAAMNGEDRTVTLTSDISVESWTQIWNITGIVIDGSGHTIEVRAIESLANHDAVFHSAGDNTFKNMTIDMSGISSASKAQGYKGISAAPGDTIENVVFIGGTYGDYGIHVGGTAAEGEKITITGCEFSGFDYAIGNQPVSGTNKSLLESLTVEECTFEDCDYVSILYSPDSEFKDNTVDGGKVNIMHSGQTVTGNDFTGESRIKFYAEPELFERNSIGSDSYLDYDDDVTEVDVSDNYWGGSGPTEGQLGGSGNASKANGVGDYYLDKDMIYKSGSENATIVAGNNTLTVDGDALIARTTAGLDVTVNVVLLRSHSGLRRKDQLLHCHYHGEGCDRNIRHHRRLPLRSHC